MIEFIGWTIVHAGWEEGLIAATLAVVLLLMRRTSASARYVVSVASLAIALVAPIATTFATIHQSPGRPISQRISVAPTPLPRVTETPAPTQVVRFSPDERSFAGSLVARVDTLLPWLVGAWLLGVALLSIRVLAGVASIRRLSSRGVSEADTRLRSIALVVAERIGLHRAVRVWQSEHVDVPMVIGWLKPAVLVPAGLLASISPAQLEMLLAHELAHIRRYDTLVNLAQTIVETLLFYHPAIWWMSARIREEREHCCDDLAISMGGNDGRAYGSMLLALEESRVAFHLAAAATDGSLLRRVRRIVVGPTTRVELGATWFAGVATMITVLVVAFPHRAPAAAPAQVVSTTATTAAISQPSQKPLVQPPAETTAMLRRSRTLLAGATAIAVATTPTMSVAQTPNFSGKWAYVADSSSTDHEWKTSSDAPKMLIIDQSDRSVSFGTSASPDSAHVTFQIDASDRNSVRLTGPVSLTMGGMNLSINVSAVTGHIAARWNDIVVNYDPPVEKIHNIQTVVSFASLTLSFEGADLLGVVDIPAVDGTPAQRVYVRLRRA